jgi:hypothetical protein
MSITAMHASRSVSVAGREEVNRLHLYPPEALARVKDEVVQFAISVGLGHAEPKACCFMQERQFAHLTFLFGV